MNIKKVGFWREMGYSKMPSIYSCIDENANKPRKLPLFIFFYMCNSPRLSTAMSSQESIIDGTRINGEVIRTDGTWVWSNSIIHYYENNRVAIPDQFLKHVKRRLIPYPCFFGLKMFFFKKKIADKMIKKLTKDFSD